MKNPRIHIEASRELVAELQEAHQALQRARVRSKKPDSAPHLERLMVALYGARQRVHVLEAPPDASTAG